MPTPDPTPVDPFRAPASPIGFILPATAGPDADEVRRLGVRRERAIRSLGLVLYLVAAWLLVFCLGSVPRTIGLMNGTTRFNDPELGRRVMVRGFWFAGVGVVLGAGIIALGSGLRRLATRARWGPVLSASLLLAWIVAELARLGLRNHRSGAFTEQLILSSLPMLLLGTILMLLITRPAGMIFTEPYRATDRATPELSRGPGWGVKILVGLLAVVALLMLFARITHTAMIRG